MLASAILADEGPRCAVELFPRRRFLEIPTLAGGVYNKPLDANANGTIDATMILCRHLVYQ